MSVRVRPIRISLEVLEHLGSSMIDQTRGFKQRRAWLKKIKIKIKKEVGGELQSECLKLGRKTGDTEKKKEMNK